jgi:hypothetical protein
LTDKVCRESCICNVKTQPLSKFFIETIPNDLQIDGIAILAFRKASLMSSSAPTSARRRLRAPIRGLRTGDDAKAFMAARQNNRDESGVSAVSVVADSSQRMVQDGTDQSKFGLEVSLQGIGGDSGDDEDSSSGGVSTIAVAAIVLVLLAAASGFAFVWSARRKRKEEPKDIVEHYSSNASTPQTTLLFRGFWTISWRTAQEYEFSHSPFQRGGFTDNSASWAGRAQMWMFDVA